LENSHILQEKCPETFAGWNKEVGGYPHTKEGQAAIYKDVVNWGINRGVKSIRYWAADYEDWGSMGLLQDVLDNWIKINK